ncbi:hypothetical protein TKK_0000897 [Trichogramma kaykai]|uniref:Uncharacterized protein n=1 Tax=Trichogramma kaykai TaxID=54128 RepID=A0ABD2VW31_9HYME
MEHFFKIIEETGQSLDIDARDKLGWTPLHLAAYYSQGKQVQSLLRRGADPNLACNDGSMALHVICNSEKVDNFMELFFKHVERANRPIELDARGNEDNTPLHRALKKRRKRTVLVLLREGADPSLTDRNGRTALHWICLLRKRLDTELFVEITEDLRHRGRIDSPALDQPVQPRRGLHGERIFQDRPEDPNLGSANGSTPLHVVCESDYGGRDFAQAFFELLADTDQCVEIDAVDDSGNAPLHLALTHEREIAMEFLLRHTANPNLANAEGLTPLHVVCQGSLDEVRFLDRFFEIAEEKNERVLLDPRNKTGNIPLHLALHNGRRKKAETLLRRGADSNVANEEGATRLHHIASRKRDDDLAEWFLVICDDIKRTVPIDTKDKSGDDLVDMFFEVNEDMRQTVRVDVQDEFGRTPLHLAVKSGSPKVTEALLRNGADSNLATANGLTPLHVICQRQKVDDGFPEKFFELVDFTDQWVQVDARDKKGWTPLQLAVANLLPKAVDVLLDHGADLSSFVFPNLDRDDERLKPKNNNSRCHKLKLAADSMAVVERLAKRGYELDREDVLKIARLFDGYGMFERTGGLEKSWYDDQRFAGIAREMTT